MTKDSKARGLHVLGVVDLEDCTEVEAENLRRVQHALDVVDLNLKAECRADERASP
jgi:hypothetical protein